MTIIKTLSGDILHFTDPTETTDEIKHKLASQFKIPVQRVCLTPCESEKTFFLLIQPPPHSYAEEFMSYLYNFRLYLLDHIFDHLDLIDTTTHHILPPTSTFKQDWSTYFELFDNFFANPSEFNAFSIITHEDGVNICALEYLISFYINYAHRQQEAWVGPVRPQIDKMLSNSTYSVEHIHKIYESLIADATSQHLHTQQVMFMALPMYAEILKALQPYLECQSWSNRFQSMEEVSDRIRQEHTLQWSAEDLMDLLSFYIHFDYSNV